MQSRQLLAVTVINCFPSRVYGEIEYYLSLVKVLTIVVISAYDSDWSLSVLKCRLRVCHITVVLSLAIDSGASRQGSVVSAIHSVLSHSY